MPKYTIQFSQQTDKDLERLMKTLGANSKADVVRGGGRIVVENDRDKTKKELIPILLGRTTSMSGWEKS